MGGNTDWCLRPSWAPYSSVRRPGLLGARGMGGGPQPPPTSQQRPQCATHASPLQAAGTSLSDQAGGAMKPRTAPRPGAPDATQGGAGREVGTGQWPRPLLHALVPSRHQSFPASLPSGLQGGSGGLHSPRQPELADRRPSPCPSLLSLGDGSPGPPAAELIPHPQAPVMGGGARCGRPPRAQVPTSDGISAALQRPGRPQPIYILSSELEWCGQGSNPQDPQAGPQPPVQATLTLSPGAGGSRQGEGGEK